jgi:hypothetical protein
VVPIEMGDSWQGRAEIYSGLKAGDRIISRGAILLKPAAANSLLWTEQSPGEAGEDQPRDPSQATGGMTDSSKEGST